MKENWEYKKLGEVASFLNGYPFKPLDWRDCGKPIIRIQNLNNPDASFNFYDGIIEDKYIITKGDILISWSGSLGVYEWKKENDAFLNQHIFKVKFDKIKINKQFFKYAVNSQINEMKNKVHGITMQHITKGEFEKTFIPVPPIEEQERIVAELDLLSGIIEKHKQQLKELDTLAQSIFYSMFGDPISNDKNWPIKKLEEVCSKITDGTHDTPERISEGVKFITGKHIRPFYVDFDNSDYVSESVHKQIYTRCNPEKGDVLYTNIGVGVGTAAVNTVNYEFSMKNVALLKIRNLINGVYLQYVLNDFNFKKFILPTFLGGGAQSFLSLKQIKLLPVIVPPFELQNEFAEKIEKIEKHKEAINKSIEETQMLFDYTMDKYFG